MIEEIDTVIKFDKATEGWLKEEHYAYWNGNAHLGLGDYIPGMATAYLKSIAAQNNKNSNILPLIKIWAYKCGEEYISAACFSGHKHPLTGKRILSETFWTARGKKADTFIEKMSLIKLLKHAEKYGKRNNFDYIRMGKVIGAHPETLDNFYLKSGYKADSLIYSKKLK